MIADAAGHEFVVTIEDGIRDGGIGMTIADLIHATNPHCVVENLGIPTEFIPHGNPDQILAAFGLDTAGITAVITSRVR